MLAGVQEAVGVPMEQLTPVGLILLAVLLLMVGLIVPKRTVDRLEKAANERIALADERARDWKEAYENEREAGTVRDAQTGELLENSRTTVHLLEELTRLGDRK